MATSLHCLTYHLIWSTKNRAPWLPEALETPLWQRLAGIARQHHIQPLAVGGHTDHVHFLVRLPPALSTDQAVGLIKGLSARWLRDSFPSLAAFAWQSGYSAFTVSPGQVEGLITCIEHQPQLHRVKTYREELIGYLNRYGIPWQAEAVWR